MLAVACWAALGEAAGAAASDGHASALHVRVVYAVPLQPTPLAIRLTDDEGLERVRTATTSRAVWLGGLRPSAYRLALDLPGRPAMEYPLVIGPGESVTVDVGVAQTGALQVGVSARWSTGAGARFSGPLLDDLPHGGDPWGLIETAAPFAIVERMDTGGLGLGRSAFVGGRGESWAVTSVAFGDARVRYPNAVGVVPIVPSLHAVDAVVVGTGLASVDVATPGVGLWLSPKRPGTRLAVTGGLSVTTPGMVGSSGRTVPPIGRVESWRGAHVLAGGPLSPSTGLLVAVDGARVRHTERDRDLRFNLASTSVLGHLVRRAGQQGELRVLAAVERTRVPFDGRRQFANENITTDATFGRLQATWDRSTAGGGQRTVSVGGQSARLAPGVTANALGGSVDRVVAGVVPDPAASERRAQWNVRATAATAPRFAAGVEHRIHTGVSVERVRVSSSVLALPDVAELVAGLPARAWWPVEPTVPSGRGITDASIFVADRVSAGRAFVIDAGLRAELTYGSARGAERGFRWATALPRVSFRWQPRLFAVFGGFGQYVAANPLMVTSFGDPGAVAFDVYRWTDPNRNGRFDAGEAGVLVARRGRNRDIASIDSALSPPTSREWTIGGEYRMGRRSTLGGAIVVRRTRGLIGSVNDGVPVSAYRAYTVFDIGGNEGDPIDDQQLPVYERLPSSFGLDRYRLTNPEGGKTTYGGVEITWAFTSARWRMLFGATAYRTRGYGGDLGFGPLENDQLVIGERFETPNGSKDVPGSFIFDRSYVGKWVGSYRAPGDVRFAFAVRYQDGQPFTRLVVLPDHAAGPEITHAYRVGRSRFTYTATVDLRVEKGITIAGRRANVRFDVFNATNHKNEVEEDVVTGSGFRRSTALQPPVTIRLGLGLSF